MRAADAGLQVLLGQPGLGARERRARACRANAACAASIGTVTVADAEVGREQLGVGDAAVAREARRHEHADDVLGPERVDRDRRDERRVDAAGEADQHVAEAVLAHVVARAEHQRLVDLVHRREQRLDARSLVVLAEVRLAHRDLGQRTRCATGRAGRAGGDGTRAARRRRRRAGLRRTAARARRGGRSRRTASTRRRRRARPVRRRGSRRATGTDASAARVASIVSRSWTRPA